MLYSSSYPEPDEKLPVLTTKNYKEELAAYRKYAKSLP
jgi:hypothetical protein